MTFRRFERYLNIQIFRHLDDALSEDINDLIYFILAHDEGGAYGYVIASRSVHQTRSSRHHQHTSLEGSIDHH